jgi:prophage tail gpP-like protein
VALSVARDAGAGHLHKARQVDVPKAQLPKHAREGHHLQIELEGDRVIRVLIDKEATERARKRIEDKLNRLRRGEHLK